MINIFSVSRSHARRQVAYGPMAARAIVAEGNRRAAEQFRSTPQPGPAFEDSKEWVRGGRVVGVSLE